MQVGKILDGNRDGLSKDSPKDEMSQRNRNGLSCKSVFARDDMRKRNRNGRGKGLRKG